VVYNLAIVQLCVGIVTKNTHCQKISISFDQNSVQENATVLSINAHCDCVCVGGDVSQCDLAVHNHDNAGVN
jgi:hypothetical protein